MKPARRIILCFPWAAGRPAVVSATYRAWLTGEVVCYIRADTKTESGHENGHKFASSEKPVKSANHYLFVFFGLFGGCAQDRTVDPLIKSERT